MAHFIDLLAMNNLDTDTLVLWKLDSDNSFNWKLDKFNSSGGPAKKKIQTA